MRFLKCFFAFTLISLPYAAPGVLDNEYLMVTKDFFLDAFIKYTGNHEIYKIIVPLNSLNFDEDDSSESLEVDSDVILFFIEADLHSEGKKTYKGLYVLKDGKATKILENGRDAAASSDESKLVFFGAEDGLYVYNQKTNAADKYGPISDSIVGIAKEKEGDVIYILTENYEVYKITNNGEDKAKLDDVLNARAIALDYSNNLYFYSEDFKPYVHAADGNKAISVPEVFANAQFVKPPFVLDEGMPFIVNNKVYILHPNGTSELAQIEFSPNAIPSAFAPEGTLIQYYGYNKKIYEFNLPKMLLEGIPEEIGGYLNSKATDIQTLATKTKSQAEKTVAKPKA